MNPIRPLPIQEKEYRQSLYRLERNAIIPIKWGVLLVTLVLWTVMIGTPFYKPVFILFLLYLLFNLAQTYLFYFSRVTLSQVKVLTLLSYLIDVVFVSMLIYIDLTALTLQELQEPHPDLYILYFLLVMRGFGLFKTIGETIFVNFLISALYVLTLFIARWGDFSFFLEPGFAMRLILIWMVILMSWLIVIVITRQKMELLEVHDRLLRADSLARIGELAAGVAHEINNPIGIIAATADYLKMRTEPGDDRLEEIEGIHKEAMRCKEIVQQMLTYANPRASGIMMLDVRPLNDEVLHFVFPRNQWKRFNVTREYEDNPPLIEADPSLLKQALLNLYINAKQAIPENREGLIGARIHAVERGRWLRIEVEDNGTGIADEDMERLFEPFFTRKAHGTGLGLAVTQQIVEKAKGKISVGKAPTGGTVFCLDFPAAEPATSG